MKTNRNESMFTEINITPLTDIFLVLLIIMMVIAPLLDQQGLKLNVPQVGAPPSKAENKYITVSISPSGSIDVEGKETSREALIFNLTDLKKTRPEGLVIQADPQAYHKDVVFVMDSARSSGIENISLMQKSQT